MEKQRETKRQKQEGTRSYHHNHDVLLFPLLRQKPAIRNWRVTAEMRRTERREMKENKEHDNMQAGLSLWLANINTDEGKAEAKERDH